MTVTDLVGRSSELELLSAVLAAASAGKPGAVVLHGEPGVGKTRLVTDAAESSDGAVRNVLWAKCLRFGTDGVAFLPVAQALSRWLEGPVPPTTRTRLLHGADDLWPLLPELPNGEGPVPGGRLMNLLASVVNRIADDGPTVLVADDLQWADPSSLDLLAYLIAGFAPGGRLAILGTYRDTELEPGHALHGWVADMRRMPGVTLRRVEGLDRMDTASLVRQRASASNPGPDPDAVFERSRGNPYLTGLIVAEADGESGTLSEALLATWHRLGPTARELTQVLAVGGGPVPAPVLSRVVGCVVGHPRSIREDVTDAQSAGVLAVDRDSVWFRHPLLAEVVGGTVDPATATEIHKAYVGVLLAADDVSDLTREGLLALHHEAAGQVTQAFAASLRAAAAAARVFASAEESQHLERACRLWDAVDPAVRNATGDRAALLERTALTASKAGRFDVCEALAKDAVAAVDATAEPLRLSGLLLRLPLNVGMSTDPYANGLAEAEHARALAQPFGLTEELAFAMAQVAFCKMWSGVDDAEADARAAVEIAEIAGSPTTLGFAHLVHAQFDLSGEKGFAEADVGWRLLWTHGSALDWGPRATMYLNALEGSVATDRLITEGIAVLTKATRLGAPTVGARVALRSARELIQLGRHDEARTILRTVHAHRQTTKTTAEARAAALLLAVRTGEMTEAQEHARRIEELWAGQGTVGTDIGDALIEFAWARGDWAAALDVVRAEIGRLWRVDPDRAAVWLVAATRSAADFAESGQTPQSRQLATKALLEVERLQPVDAEPPPTNARRLLTAALLAAERSRLSQSGDQEERWAAAQKAAREVRQPWEESWAAYQRGRVLLQERGRRPHAAVALRDAHRIADRIGAQPLARRAAELATQAHIRLDPEPEPTIGDTDQARTVLRGVTLTPREAEVLRHLLAGRTYGEIASALFISKKTVSVHVSNLLRKTSTKSRIELAELARRSTNR